MWRIGKTVPSVPTSNTAVHGATVFSKLDLRSGYHHLVLHQSYRYFTAFPTYLAFHQYKTLIIGINATAAELFQHTVKTVITNIPGAKSISDDKVANGKDLNYHDLAVKSSTWLPKAGLTVNLPTCELNDPSMRFF